MNVNEIRFPVYKLTETTTVKHSGGVAFVETYLGNMYILDDLGIQQPTLARRRLVIADMLKDKKENVPLYPLKYMYEGWWQIIASKSKVRKFIDSNGRVFRYKPTKVYPVKYYRVKKQTIVEKSHTILALEGFFGTFNIPRPLPDGTKFCGIARSHFGNIIVDIIPKGGEKRSKIKV